MDYRTMFRLDGKHAVVIGCGGIGTEVAAGLAAQGARVTCVDADLAIAERAAARVMEYAEPPATPGAEPPAPPGASAATGEAEGLSRAVTAYPSVAVQVDVLDPDQLGTVATDLGAVDVLVLTAARNVRKPVLDYSVEEFDQVVSLNLRGTFNVLQAFGAGMAARGSGSIIALSSIRALTVEPGQGAYAATKAGMVQLLRALAAELGPQGVRVNAVAPGVVETPLTQQIRDDEAWGRAYAEKSALGRWARPEELVGAVAYLASDAASFVTGSQLLVDGGWTAVDGRFTPPFG